MAWTTMGCKYLPALAEPNSNLYVKTSSYRYQGTSDLQLERMNVYFNEVLDLLLNLSIVILVLTEHRGQVKSMYLARSWLT